MEAGDDESTQAAHCNTLEQRLANVDEEHGRTKVLFLFCFCSLFIFFRSFLCCFCFFCFVFNFSFSFVFIYFYCFCFFILLGNTRRGLQLAKEDSYHYCIRPLDFSAASTFASTGTSRSYPDSIDVLTDVTASIHPASLVPTPIGEPSTQPKQVLLPSVRSISSSHPQVRELIKGSPH